VKECYQLINIKRCLLSPGRTFISCSPVVAFTKLYTWRRRCRGSFITISIHSFIPKFFSALSWNLVRGAVCPASVKDKCIKKRTERRHTVPWQQAQQPPVHVT